MHAEREKELTAVMHIVLEDVPYDPLARAVTTPDTLMARYRDQPIPPASLP